MEPLYALINVGERSGSGLCDVYHVWEENDFKRPEILETVDPDRITLILQTDSDGNHDGNDGNLDGNDGNLDGNDTNLTSNESRILQALTAQPDLSAAKIAEKISVSKSTVERALRSLKKKGFIYREGSTHGKWVILKYRR